jgi:hypothetical protein
MQTDAETEKQAFFAGVGADVHGAVRQIGMMPPAASF